ncbi:MAG: phosphatase PAP2 family protein [Blautia wexlerae]|mgnify:FL=1|nr:phosphatase PAP2 family protein [uncultured Blautia sp.]MBD9164471.1 phosphatase PAP2 family protein [Blautia wexlerae]
MATLQQLDMNILLWIQEHLRVDALTLFWRAVTFLGNGGWFWIVLCVLLICFRKTRKTGVTAAFSLLSGFLITNLLIKNAVARPRPFDTYTQIIPLITRPKDYSFPSGHTCASFAVALVCLWMLPGKWGILAVVLAGMIAFSRLYLGVHYPGDVLAGFLVALITSTVACRLMRRTFPPEKS